MVVARAPLASIEGQTIKTAIAQASQVRGESFDYLVKTAVKESSLQADAKAQGSSAAGLFQFIESTWLRLVRDYGDKYGLGSYSKDIKGSSDGRPKVEDAATKEKILTLRFDPKVSAQMAAELTAENRASLQGALGRPVGDTELYLAHFLGAGGATRFLTERQTGAGQSAATLFPEAAAANKSIFFDAGRPRSLDEVYDRLAKGFSDTPTFVADAGPKNSTDSSTGSSISVEEFVAQLFRTAGVPSPNLGMSSTLMAALASMEPVRALGGSANLEDRRRVGTGLFGT
jgi:muramidase (phage lysozyme)